MTPEHRLHEITRRHFFGRCGVGLGAIALNQLLSEDGLGAGGPTIDPAHPMNPRVPHFAPKAKRVIYLFMAGGPSQLETYDMKPDRDDPTAVVDGDGRVIGLDGLLVIDASIIPRIPSANTHLCVIALAERLAATWRSVRTARS